MNKPLHVAVGVILNESGEVLVSQRSRNSHMGGYWEFPGGKVESSESVSDALNRELREELGISIENSLSFPLTKIEHQYPTKSVLLDVWTVTDFAGDPVGREGQALKWLKLQELDPNEFPPANKRIIALLQLPRLIAITRDAKNAEQFLENLAHLQSRRPELVIIRQTQLPEDELLTWCNQATSIYKSGNTKLILNTTIDTFEQSNADGLHLNALRLLQLSSRPVSDEVLLGASCHNEKELQHAEAIGVDFVCLSPVNTTTTHPGVQLLGWQQFSALANCVSVPVYARGGMKLNDLPLAAKHGAYGIAGISAWD